MSSSHSFHERTFTKLTYCDYCTKLLWGVAKQGVTCEACHYNCHKKCSELVYNNCIQSIYAPNHDESLDRASPLKPNKSHTGHSSSNDSGTKTSPPLLRANSEGMRVSIPPAIVSSSQPLQRLNEKPRQRQESHQKPDLSKDDPQGPTSPVPGRTSFLEDAIISAAIRMSMPGDVSSLPKNDHPPLTIQATTINFTRFVHKTSGLFWFQDRVEDILTWKDPWNTTFVLVLYCFVCIYPLLLFLLPQCIMAAIMIYFFQQKSLKQQQKMLDIRTSQTTLGGPTIPLTQQQHQQSQPGATTAAEEAYIEAQERAHRKRHHVYHEEDYLEAPSSSEDEIEDEERKSIALQYMSNLQHIQNMMGDVSDAHDVLKPLFKHLDWSDEAEAIMIVQGVMAAFVGMSLIMWFVPWRWVFMIGGASGMLANSPWGKIVIKECIPLAKDVAAWGKVQMLEFKKKKVQDS